MKTISNTTKAAFVCGVAALALPASLSAQEQWGQASAETAAENTLTVTGISSFKRARLASTCLNAASVLLPGGFFAGGIYIYDGDPGLGVFLAPIGGLALGLLLFTVLHPRLRASPAGVTDSGVAGGGVGD